MTNTPDTTVKPVQPTPTDAKPVVLPTNEPPKAQATAAAPAAPATTPGR